MNPPTVSDAPGRVDSRPPEPESEAETYTLQVSFDAENGNFRASFLEFPECRVTDVSRKEAIYAAEDKLHSHLAALRQSGKPVPLPIRQREYPSTLEIPVSQSLYRKLDVRRYQERVSLEQLITEILTAAVEKRTESQPSGGKDRRGGGTHPPKQGQRQGGRGGNRRNFHETMQNRENFMEYVRNLEKGGGSPGYKKR